MVRFKLIVPTWPLLFTVDVKQQNNNNNTCAQCLFASFIYRKAKLLFVRDIRVATLYSLNITMV